LSAVVLALQSPGGSVSGAIIDATTGEPLAGAVVSLTDLDRAVSADERGRYHLGAVPPGPQHLTARYLGYAPRTVHALVPRKGDVEISIALARVPMTLAAVNVRPRVPVRGAGFPRAERGADRVMSIAEIRHHPLLAELDVFEAVGGGEIAVDPEAPGGVHVHGAAADQTAYLLDGIPVFSPYHAAGMFSAFNPDAVAEIAVYSSSLAPEHGAALGGVIAASTRPPGDRLRGQGSASVTQARLTFDGPLPGTAGGILVSTRSGFPGLLAGARDASHVVGESGDRLAKFERVVGHGALRLLYYDSENELSAASGSATTASAARNAFEWASRSVGGEWRGGSHGGTVMVRAWSASGASGAVWMPESTTAARVESERRDLGTLALVERRHGATVTTAVLRIDQSRTRIARAGPPPVTDSAREARSSRAGIFAVALHHKRAFGRSWSAQADVRGEHTRGSSTVSPGLAVRWSPGDRLAIGAAFARRHQFAQSVRNDESLVGTIFPADLFLGAGNGVPIARGDQAVVTLAVRPHASAEIAVRGYARRARGLLIAAASTGDPVGLRGILTGTTHVRGASVDASVSGARFGALASYGWLRSRIAHAAGDYAPRYAAAHRVDAGVVTFPDPTLSLRLGATMIAGRTATPSYGLVEWESCNLLDLGCEFGGSPVTRPEEAGALGLPSYLRVDVGARKHWHVRLRGHDVAVAAFATVTNLISRSNTLAYVFDERTGIREPVGMRPIAPLVAGLDWRF
jgi:hypothetical protein